MTGVRRTVRSRNRFTNDVWRCIPPGLPKLPVRIQSIRLTYEHSVLFGPCWMPRSSNTDTLSAPAMRRAAARMRLSSTPQCVGVARDVDLARSARARPRHRSTCAARNLAVDQVLLHQRPRPARRGTRRPCPAARAGGSRRAWRCRSRRGRSRSSTAPGPWRSRAAPHARAGSSATSMGSCRRTPRPRRARTRRGCGPRRASARPIPRPSSPGRARSSGSGSRAPAGTRRCRLPPRWFPWPPPP